MVRLKSGEWLVIPGANHYAIDDDQYVIHIPEANHRIFFNVKEVVCIGHEDCFKDMGVINMQNHIVTPKEPGTTNTSGGKSSW